MSAREFEAARLLGDRLRARRTTLGLSQDDVAHLSGVDLTNYGKLERGIGNPTLHTLLRLAITLGVDPTALVGGLADPALLLERDRPLSARDYVTARRALEGRPPL